MEFLFYAISAAALAAFTAGRRQWAYALLAVSVGFLFSGKGEGARAHEGLPPAAVYVHRPKRSYISSPHVQESIRHPYPYSRFPGR